MRFLHGRIVITDLPLELIRTYILLCNMLMRYLPPYAAHDAPFSPSLILLGRAGFGAMPRSWRTIPSFVFTSPRR